MHVYNRGRFVTVYMCDLCVDILPHLSLRYKTRGLTFDSRRGPRKFSSALILLSAFSSPGVHLASNRNEYQGVSLGGKVRPVRRADNSTVLAVPNVTVRIEAQYYIPALSLYDLLWESFTFKVASTQAVDGSMIEHVLYA